MRERENERERMREREREHIPTAKMWLRRNNTSLFEVGRARRVNRCTLNGRALTRGENWVLNDENQSLLVPFHPTPKRRTDGLFKYKLPILCCIDELLLLPTIA